MSKLLSFRSLIIFILLVVIVFGGTYFFNNQNNNDNTLITTLVETGTVRELVSVSGIAEAEKRAELGFSTSGIVEKILVTTGDEVLEGQVLVTLQSNTLLADRTEALAAINSAEATLTEIMTGPTETAKNVTSEKLMSAFTTLQQTKVRNDLNVTNAYRTLLSTDLEAYTKEADNDATPPTISGTYTCGEEGVYIIDVYSSASFSDYSYILSGLEEGRYVASDEQPAPLGDCGLQIVFSEDSKYHGSTWLIEIPNTKSNLYTINKNNYDLAISEREAAITEAEQTVALAEAEAINQNAPARTEEFIKARAALKQAEARLNRIDAMISDRSLKAPFSGTITDTDIIAGEIVTSAPILTLLAQEEFEVTARIPEIDIGKLQVGQKVDMLFDAKNDGITRGYISFISLQATEIDGVSYYEATINFNDIPTWIRSGLNADIDIIVAEEQNAKVIPKRFLIAEPDGSTAVLRQVGERSVYTPVTVSFMGNDGQVGINGLEVGEVIVAP